MNALLATCCLPLLLAASDAPTPVRTETTDAAAREQLLGTHALTLQWMDGDKPGTADITADGELLSLRGGQRSKTGDFLEVQGVLERVDAHSFVMVGSITTRVGFIAGGKVCPRQGRFTFRMTGKRRYWRLLEKDNPCEHVVDYVDLFLR